MLPLLYADHLRENLKTTGNVIERSNLRVTIRELFWMTRLTSGPSISPKLSLLIVRLCIVVTCA